MSLNFFKLSKSPKNFLHLTGVKIEEFRELVERIKSDWERIQESKKCDGRTAQLSTIEDQVLCTLLYYRTYNSQEFLGFLFDLHESNICRLLKKIEPLMAKKITIVKDRSLTPEKIMKLITRRYWDQNSKTKEWSEKVLFRQEKDSHDQVWADDVGGWKDNFSFKMLLRKSSRLHHQSSAEATSERLWKVWRWAIKAGRRLRTTSSYRLKRKKISRWPKKKNFTTRLSLPSASRLSTNSES